MKKEESIFKKFKNNFKDKKKRRHMFIVVFAVLVMAGLMTVARTQKTTVNDVEIQHTEFVVEEYETDAADQESTPGTEETPATQETPGAAETPAVEETPVTEETSEQIFFLEETTPYVE